MSWAVFSSANIPPHVELSLSRLRGVIRHGSPEYGVHFEHKLEPVPSADIQHAVAGSC